MVYYATLQLHNGKITSSKYLQGTESVGLREAWIKQGFSC